VGPDTSTSPTPGASSLSRFGLWWWRWLPKHAHRFSMTLGVALSDGSYVLAWPAAAALVPPACLGVGLALGALHPGPVFSASTLVLIVFAFVSGIGAGQGTWTWLGFAIGGIFNDDRRDLPTVSAPLGLALVVLANLLTWALLVIGPLLALSARWLIHSTSRHWPGWLKVGVSPVIYVFVLAFYTFGWAHAAAFLVRPLWSYAGSTPDISSVAPLQRWAPVLGLVAGVVACARLWLEKVARSRGWRADLPPAGREPAPIAARVVGQFLLVTFLLSGFATNAVEAVVLVAGVALVVALRLLIVPRASQWVIKVRRVPVILRIALCVTFGYVCAQLVVVPAARSGTQSFASMLGVILLSLVLSSVLIPGPGRRRAGASDHAAPARPT
jgi:hypothetical protein